MYVGAIHPPATTSEAQARRELEAQGIVLGDWDPRFWAFGNCRIPDGQRAWLRANGYGYSATPARGRRP